MLQSCTIRGETQIFLNFLHTMAQVRDLRQQEGTRAGAGGTINHAAYIHKCHSTHIYE